MKFNFFKKIWGRREEEGKEEKKEVKKETDRKEPEIAQGVDVFITPLITEKTMNLTKEGKYVFLVDPKYNKTQIRKAIEKIFNVKVKKIKVMNYQKRLRNRLKLKSVRPRFKKAIVNLEAGQRIPLFE